jgi:chromosomal replication initiation ATPase DnaA
MARERRSLQDLIRSRQQSGFVGRQGQVIQYQENFSFPVDDERRRFLFNIHGDAGVGKTYLTKQLRQIAIDNGFLTAYIDESVEDAVSAMTAIAEEFSRILQLPFHVEWLTDRSSVTAGSAVKATLCGGQG